MAATFSWRPDLGSERAVKSTAAPTKFGDGYEVRITTSLNVTPRQWNVQFTTALQTHKEILAFLQARKGIEAFNWIDPLGDTATYKCSEWKSKQIGFGVFQVSGTFEEVFEY